MRHFAKQACVAYSIHNLILLFVTCLLQEKYGLKVTAFNDYLIC